MSRTSDRSYREAQNRKAAEREIAKAAWRTVYAKACVDFEALRQEMRIERGLVDPPPPFRPPAPHPPKPRTSRRVSGNRNQTFHEFVLELLEAGHLDDVEGPFMDLIEMFLNRPTTTNRTKLLQHMRLRPDLLSAADFIKFA